MDLVYLKLQALMQIILVPAIVKLGLAPNPTYFYLRYCHEQLNCNSGGINLPRRPREEQE
jgi:hypothetical protein